MRQSFLIKSSQIYCWSGEIPVSNSPRIFKTHQVRKFEKPELLVKLFQHIFLTRCLLWTSVLCSVIRNPYSLEESPDIHSDDELDDDPSQALGYLHAPSEEDCAIHRISRTLLSITKDLISYAPRSKTLYAEPRERLRTLRSLGPREVRSLLLQNSVSLPSPHNVTCGPNALHYRTPDGSCNNLASPCWGKAEEAYHRWLPPLYDNGVDEPRSRSKSGNPLPSPRQVYQWVSSQFEPTRDTAYLSFTNLVVVWGQLIAHDIVLTPTVTVKVWDGKGFKNEKPHCCDAAVRHPECIPIMVDKEDGFYPPGHCMDIVRSTAHLYSPYSCAPLQLGKPREQMNQLTSFLDASLVYGTSETEMRKLRENDGVGAKLIMDHSSRWSYPVRKNGTRCKSSSDKCDRKCFLTGEKRANENPVLGAMHTLWAREHNRLVDRLRVKGWPEETLFHVVRKIVGALLQHTTYKEYLSLIVGPTLSGLLKLSVPTEGGYRYDSSVNPTLYNAFATAAFRFGHSMVTTRQLRAGRELDRSPLLSQDFFSMDDFCGAQGDPVANLLFGQLQQKAQRVDCLFSKQLTNHLFAKQPNGKGLDLFSLNVQRGRDHGLPPYNEWRKACGLPKARDYSDLKGAMPDYIVDRLEQIYGPGNVDEIDLYVGGISELAANDGILGPTFTCIIANQFRHIKLGDRFWYENLDHPGAFTPAQVASIQKTTVASLICRNTDIREVPRMALILESMYNPKVACDSIVQQTDLDLELW